MEAKRRSVVRVLRSCLPRLQVLLVAASVGAVVVVGTVATPAGATTGVGSPDSNFGAAGVAQIPSVNGSLNAVAYDATGGDVVAAGSEGSSNVLAVTRFTSSGAPDPTFTSGGTAGLSILSSAGSFLGVAAYPTAAGFAASGQVLAGGYETVGGNSQAPVLFRFKTNGQEDSSFADFSSSCDAFVLANDAPMTTCTSDTSRVSKVAAVAIETFAGFVDDTVVVGTLATPNDQFGQAFVALVDTSGAID